jgi:hypothetical protein
MPYNIRANSWKIKITNATLASILLVGPDAERCAQKRHLEASGTSTHDVQACNELYMRLVRMTALAAQETLIADSAVFVKVISRLTIIETTIRAAPVRIYHATARPLAIRKVASICDRFTSGIGPQNSGHML